MKNYNKSILANGVTVISEAKTTYNSAMISLWINTGSRYEQNGEEGYSHLVEHMLFKGTANKSGKQIVAEIEKLGGEINAFTTREHTCYTVSVLGKDVKKAIEILCDIYQNSTISEENLELEKSVILNELISVDDDPEEFLIDKIYEFVFENSKLAQSILGTQASIENCTPNKLMDFYKKHYKTGNIVFIVSGNALHDEVINHIYNNIKNDTGSNINEIKLEQLEEKQIVKIIPKQLELIHFGIAFRSIPFKNEQKCFPLLLNTILGEGMNSRLFQEIRENTGLVYNIFSDISFYKDVSILIIYFSCEKDKIIKTIEKLLDELKNIKNNFISIEQFGEYKEQLMGTMEIELDNLENRIQTIAKEHFYLGKNISIKDYKKEIKNIDMRSMHTFIRNTLDIKKSSSVILGDVCEIEKFKIYGALEYEKNNN